MKKILNILKLNGTLNKNTANSLKSGKALKFYAYFLAAAALSLFAAFFTVNYIKSKIILAGINLINPYTPYGNISSKPVSDIKKYNGIIKSNPFNAAVNGQLMQYGGNASFLPFSLKLIGVIKGTINFAFFTDNLKNGKETFAAEGSSVIPGYTLYRVNSRNVIIESGGVKKTLYLVEGSEAGAYGSEPGQALSLNGNPGNNPLSSLNNAIKKTGPFSYEINKSMLHKSELNSIFTKMHAVPDIANGKVIGYKVLSVMPAGIFNYMGFMPGDIIKNINGTPLKNPQEAVNLLTGLFNQNSISVNLIRNNSPITLNYNINS
ncbi:MAG: hypothetical protein ACYDDB_03605 [bacterium]